MKKILICCLFCLFWGFVSYSQEGIVKKCKTCGKPIKECKYKGNHPQSTPTAYTQTSEESLNRIKRAKKLIAKRVYLKAKGELNRINDKYRDGEFWELYGDCDYYNGHNSWSCNWYNHYRRSVERGNVSAKVKLLYDARSHSRYGSRGINANSTESEIMFERALQENKISEQIRLYKSAAEQGNIYAAFNLGIIYEFGESGVAIDYAEAARYYKMSNTIQSRLHLAWLYRHGLGVEENLTKSFELYSSLMANEVIAKYNVATCYEGGIGTSRNIAKALELYREILNMDDESDFYVRYCKQIARQKCKELSNDNLEY